MIFIQPCRDLRGEVIINWLLMKKDPWMHTYFIYGQNSCSMKLTTINSSESFGIFTVLGNWPSYLVIKHTCKSKVKLLVHLGVNLFLLHKALPIFILLQSNYQSSFSLWIYSFWILHKNRILWPFNVLTFLWLTLYSVFIRVLACISTLLLSIVECSVMFCISLYIPSHW